MNNGIHGINEVDIRTWGTPELTKDDGAPVIINFLVVKINKVFISDSKALLFLSIAHKKRGGGRGKEKEK